MTYVSGGTLRGVLRQMTPVTPPAVSVAGEGRIYFNGTTFQVSQNGGAYATLVGGGGGTLASVLASGNTTGGTSIIVSSGDEIRGAVGLTLTTTPGLNTGDVVALTANSTGDGGSSGAVTLGSGTADFGTTGGASTGTVTIRSGAFTGTTNDQGDATGDISILVGNGTSLTGDNAVGGSVTLSAGATTNDNATSGSVTINAGDAAGTNSTGGSLTLGAGGGYTAGSISIASQIPGPGGGGNISISCGGDTFTIFAEDTIYLGTNAACNEVRIGDSGASSPAIDVVNGSGVTIAAPTVTINGNDATLGTGSGNVSMQTQNGTMGGDSTRLFITPNLGIILEIGNTIKIDPDGTNNWIYGDDAAVAATPGEPLTLRGGQGNTSGAGGELRLRGGAGGATGAGANAVIAGGAGGATSGAAGGVTMSGGTPIDGNGGSVTISGSAGVGTDRNGGNLTLSSGTQTGTGTAGNVVIAAANGAVNNGGEVTITSGNGGTGAQAGFIFVTAGNSQSVAGGAVIVSAGNGAAAAVSGGQATLQGGNGNTTAAGGVANVYGGVGGATGNGGGVHLQGGQGGATSGNGGGILLEGGVPTDGNGGSLTLTGSAGVGTDRDGGSITLTAGNATGTGAPGIISIACGTDGSVGIGAEGPSAFIQLAYSDATPWTALTLDTAGITATFPGGGIFTVDGTLVTNGDATIAGAGSALSFHGAAAVAQQTVTGSRGGNAALASLLTALAVLGLIVDGTTA